MSEFQRDLTEGSVMKQLLRFSLPFLLSNLLQALYNLADMLIVGNFCGPVGTSAVGIGGQVTILLINLISGLAVGGTVMIAQFIGSKRQEEVVRTIGTMFSLYLIAGVVLTAVMLLSNHTILVLMGTPPESFADAYAYLTICMSGTLFIFGYNAVSAVLRGMGDSRHPLIFVAVAAVVNVALDFAMVGGMGMGPAGAAWATIIAQAVSFILSVVFLRRRNFVFDFKPKSFRIDRRLAVQLLKIGLPSSLQGTLVCFSFMALTRMGNDIGGLVGSNALSIAGKVNSIGILPSMAMQASVSSMVGQNIGAGKPERAKRTMLCAIGIAFAVSALLFAGVNLFPREIVGLFLGSPDSSALDPELFQRCIVEGAEYLQWISMDYLVASVVFCINGLAIGVGQTTFSLFNSFVSSLLLRVPLAWLLGVALNGGLPGVGVAAPLAEAGALVIGIVYLCTGRWKKNRLGILAEAAAASPSPDTAG
ncbi:MAG: MATE family efflux transporter [Clostridiales bacterium]|nr:MATE family efflux transporter [Clostridiales bacterium]